MGSSWLDRIPFVLLFGIATSVDIFQDCLPRTAVRCLQAQSFDVVKSESVLERVFEASTFGNHVKLRVGPALSDMLLQRQRDHVQSIEAFVQALKVCLPLRLFPISRSQTIVRLHVSLLWKFLEYFPIARSPI